MERRVFKEALMAYYKIIYVFVAVVCVFCMWYRHILVAVPLIVILLLITDRLIKGEYIMESEVLILRRGRFIKERAILLKSVRSLVLHKGISALRGNVELVLDDERVFLNPENADSFVESLCRRNSGISVNR